MSRTRVLFCICEMTAGGSQRQMLNILERLDRSRFEPHLFLISPHGQLLNDVPDDVETHIAHRPGSARNLLKSVFAHRHRVNDLVRLLRKKQVDVIYDRTYHMTLIAGGATQKHRVPRASVIVTDPELDFETNPERLRWLKRRMLRKAYHSADAVVAVSDGVRQAAIQYYGILESRIETIWNSFDVEQLERRSHELLPSALQRRPGRFRIVSAGRLHEQKGFDVLIEAARQLVFERKQSHIEFIIAGTGEQENRLRSLIARHGLADHVTLAGFQSNPLPLFRSADLFCLSSRYEGMPNVLIEAMCCDVPVLATDCPSGPRDILQDRFGRLIPSDDAAALAEAVREIVSSPDVARSLVPAAREFVRTTFGIQSGVAQVEALLLELASRQRSDTPSKRA